MIFIFNSKIEDPSKYKNFIQSISEYDWKRVIIYYETDSSENIEDFNKNIFNHTDLIMRNKINSNQQDWIDTYKLLNDDLIWVTSRYDHLFVDNDFDHLKEVLEFRLAGGTDKLASIYLSDWRYALKKCVIIDHGLWDGTDHTAPTQAWMTNKECDSFQVVTKELYKEWWLSQDLGDALVESPEQLNSAKKFIRPWKVQVPSRELCRHIETITEETNFTDLSLPIGLRKSRLLRYYLSGVSPTDLCLANPKVDRGIMNRVMKYYGFKRRGSGK